MSHPFPICNSSYLHLSFSFWTVSHVSHLSARLSQTRTRLSSLLRFDGQVPHNQHTILRQYELVESVLGYDPDADEALLNRAYVYTVQKHGTQTRASGDPYFSHPVEVAGLMTDLDRKSTRLNSSH